MNNYGILLAAEREEIAKASAILTVQKALLNERVKWGRGTMDMS